MKGPAVSVILPTLNERRFIRDCLDSLLAQDYPAVAEVIVADGGSTDGTRDIVAAMPPPIRLVENHGVTAAAAMNVGLREASGEVVVRADAHTLYAPNYVRRCVEVLDETGAENVGGLMRPVGTTRFGRGVATATSSPIGVGPGKFHYSEHRQEVDTVYLGCWRKTTLEALGGWDETTIQWAAEDQDLNFRLRRKGGRVLLDPTIRSTYFVRESPGALARQYANYGVCKASTLVKHGTLPSPRPLAPAGLVVVALTGLLFGRTWRRLLVPLVHGGGVAAVLWAKRHRDDDLLRSWAAVEICHWAYGYGFWSGLVRHVSGRGFDARPRPRR